MATDELQRKFRVADQMLTQHAALRDRYRHRSLALKLFLLLWSVFLCGMTLITVSDWAIIGIEPQIGRWILAITGCTVFFLSLAEMLVKWTESYEAHRTATVRLADLKARLREHLYQTEIPERTAKRLAQDCDNMMSELVPIPECEFLRLKARHVRKVAISRALDVRPGAPLWLLHLELKFAALRRTKVECNNESVKPDGQA